MSNDASLLVYARTCIYSPFNGILLLFSRGVESIGISIFPWMYWPLFSSEGYYIVFPASIWDRPLFLHCQGHWDIKNKMQQYYGVLSLDISTCNIFCMLAGNQQLSWPWYYTCKLILAQRLMLAFWYENRYKSFFSEHKHPWRTRPSVNSRPGLYYNI